MKGRLFTVILVLLACVSLVFADGKCNKESYVNSMGMRMIRIEPGTFTMGNHSKLPEDMTDEREIIEHGDYDEYPRHKVTITEPFYISQTEVTINHFRQFKAEYPGYDKFRPYASGISWHEAVKFTEWLSNKEGKTYRLPTEAEWEYACRAGTTTPFSSGDTPPEPNQPNPWGIKNMHTGVREWTLDWYGIYPEQDQVDPAGPSRGWFKVIRGGSLDFSADNDPYYARSSNRGALGPAFGPPPLEYQYKQLQTADLTFNLPKPLLEMEHHEYSLARFPDVNVTFAEALNTPFRYGGGYLPEGVTIRTSGFIPGKNEIGIRLVQAPQPDKHSPFDRPFVHECVKQTSVGTGKGPELDEPYYRTRMLFPDFGKESLWTAWKLGVEQGYGGSHHNSALEVLPNGDMLAFYYNTIFGYERGHCVSIMSMRYRHGSESWDIPSSWPDHVDCDDEAPVIWDDNGTLWLFWGSPRQTEGRPFQFIKSEDNGANWGPVQFPIFNKRVGPFSAQPINSAFRDSRGNVYIAVDGSHTPKTSELFVSKDNGSTWYDTGGRTYGRHSTFIILEDDTIMAFGGKQATMNGYHPLNISTNYGESYKVIASQIPALGGGRRASLIQLHNGHLFFVGDMNLNKDLTAADMPEGWEGNGAYAAISTDKGKTWQVRKLTGGNILDEEGNPVKVTTVSYVTARQSKNGMIHIITSHNHPDLHFELNEAWVLAGKDGRRIAKPEHLDMKPGTVKKYEETYPDGETKVVWHAGLTRNGYYRLHGKETWYYENGQKHWQATYDAGHKVGTETYWRPDGSRKWQKEHKENGTYKWFTYGPHGRQRAVSTWKGKKLLSCDVDEPYYLYDRKH